MKASCVHCSPRGRDDFEEEKPGPVFTAQHKGYCYGCTGTVAPGDELRMWDGMPYHTVCLPERFRE